MIAMTRSIFLGSILDDFWCLGRPSGASVAIDPSFRWGAVTGRIGNELPQKGSNALRNLCRNGPTVKFPVSLLHEWKLIQAPRNEREGIDYNHIKEQQNRSQEMISLLFFLFLTGRHLYSLAKERKGGEKVIFNIITSSRLSDRYFPQIWLKFQKE